MLNTCRHGKMEEPESRLLMRVCVHWWLRGGSTFVCERWLCRLLATTFGWTGGSLETGWYCQFTDYEPGIHICQLQMQSGVTGINTIRMYNPYKQSEDLDPEGVFIKRWLPELADVPTEYIHKPHEMAPLMQMMTGVDLCISNRLSTLSSRLALQKRRSLPSRSLWKPSASHSKSFSVMGRDGKGSVGPLVWFYKR